MVTASLPWTATDIRKLIDSYKKSEVLWKTNHADYGKRGPRYKALKKITLEFNGKGKFISNNHACQVAK
jgi:hypothetical protein